MSEDTRHIAVLTGDLVNSTDLGPEKIDRAFKALERCAETQTNWHGQPLRFTRHRGDGWQVVLAKPKLALRSALAFRAAIRSEGAEFDTYMGVAEGYLEKDIGPDLNDETAEVFIRSGTWLDWTKNNTLSGGSRIGHDSASMLPVAILADHISKAWTSAQATAILPFLTPDNEPSYTEIAKILGKSRQAVTKAVDAAALPPLRASLIAVESAHD